MVRQNCLSMEQGLNFFELIQRGLQGTGGNKTEKATKIKRTGAQILIMLLNYKAKDSQSVVESMLQL